MMHRIRVAATVAALACLTTIAAAAPIVILKLDDVTRDGARGQAPISPRWQKCVDFLDQEHVKASLGIIGYSLEKDSEPYFNWIKDLNKKGLVEFWNHCYDGRPDRFKGTSLDEQKAALRKTQQLARDKLGITLKAFGVHWSSIDATTDAAVASLPDIRVWFEGPEHPKGGQVVLKRTIQLEQPTFVPNFEAVKSGYEKHGHREPYLLLQGHPNQWDDKRFADFVRIVKYLKAQGCSFMTVSEYADSKAKDSHDR